MTDDDIELVARAIVPCVANGWDRMPERKWVLLKPVARAVLVALEAAGWRKVSEGNVVVPEERTGVMDEAGAKAAKWWEKAISNGEVPRRSLWDTIYRAMLAAANEKSAQKEAP